MPIYQKALGDTARKARCRAKLSQTELAEMLDIELRTIVDIENYRSNLTMKILYPLITMLHINPADIFCPDYTDISNGATAALRAKLTACSKEEAILLNEICEAAFCTLRNPKDYSVYKQK